jgi:hypothetical protein
VFTGRRVTWKVTAMRKILFQVKRWLKGVQKIGQPVMVEVRRAPESPRLDCVAQSLCTRNDGPRVKRVW